MAEKNVYADAIGEYLWKTKEFGFREAEILVIHTDAAGAADPKSPAHKDNHSAEALPPRGRIEGTPRIGSPDAESYAVEDACLDDEGKDLEYPETEEHIRLREIGKRHRHRMDHDQGGRETTRDKKGSIRVSQR